MTAKCSVGCCSGSAPRCSTVALATALFVIWRLRQATRPIRQRAKTSARDYVPTAVNSIMDQVVGRDQLCNVIMLGLKDRHARRPHLLIGGVGAGKTAVMVHLTELAARRGLIPVPILLREVGDEDLDFSELARQRFCRVVDEEMLKKALGARHDGRPGMAMASEGGQGDCPRRRARRGVRRGREERDRDNLIRRAIREADQQGLPFVVASRPHALLRDVEAAITELEPLSEEAGARLHRAQPAQRGRASPGLGGGTGRRHRGAAVPPGHPAATPVSPVEVRRRWSTRRPQARHP